VKAETVPIEDYGLLGDTRTAALVTRSGSIDWMCFPAFDGSPIFGRLVLGTNGGHFELSIEGASPTHRRYVGNSSTIETTWETDSATLLVRDCMIADVSSLLLPRLLLVRSVECHSGTGVAKVHWSPRFGRDRLRIETRTNAEWLIASNSEYSLSLTTDRGLPPLVDEEASYSLQTGERMTIVCAGAYREPLPLLRARDAIALVDRDISWWETWASEITYEGPHAEMVRRSLITVRLLTFAPSGAPVAAPTTSLPERVGHDSNWDYRLAWPRDASLGVYAFAACGKHAEARAFMNWLLHASRLTRPRLSVVYTLWGKPPPTERTVAGAAGYARSLPVRTGNAAADQTQLDVYGWVLAAARRLVGENPDFLTSDMCGALRGFANHVVENWKKSDAGIWEQRDKDEQFVHSKGMAWVALDAGIDLARSIGAKHTDVARWLAARDEIAADIWKSGRRKDGALAQSYGSQDLDASVLLLAWLQFGRTSAGDGMALTVDRIRTELEQKPGLLYRTSAFRAREGIFSVCGFWLVLALLAIGDGNEARATFEATCASANDLGLFAEELDPRIGRFLGNFPQSFVHSSLAIAASALDRVPRTTTA
jgi:GH15 family glucan-1,4-alpha-glucosidase